MKDEDEIKEEIVSLRKIIDGHNESHFLAIPVDAIRQTEARIETLKWVLDE
jgi:hypothetical protein